jgi:hypothetical protein
MAVCVNKSFLVAAGKVLIVKYGNSMAEHVDDNDLHRADLSFGMLEPPIEGEDDEGQA